MKKLIARLTSWVEAIGNFWDTYWLLLIGSFLVVGSMILKWIEFPISRNLRGIQIPLFHDIGLMPHTTVFSFGIVGMVALIGGLLFFRLSAGLLAAAAAVMLTVFALVPAYMAFEQPTMLQRLTEESEAIPLINAFTKDYLPQNYGAAEIVPKRFVLYSGWGRFVTAWSYLRLGWYIYGIGALLVGLYALSLLRGQRGFIAIAMFGLPVAALVVVLTPAMLGQHFYTEGAVAKAEGRNQDAIADFRAAMRWDSWHTQDIDLYGTIGELQRAAGIAEGSPERHINTALAFEKQSEWERAIFEFEVAAQTRNAIGDAARREAARAHVSLGLALYNAGGIGSAVTNWQQAMAEDPMQIYGLFYLARGYFDIGSYDASIKTVDEIVDIVKDHDSLLGNAYSLGGDAYAKLGRNSEARDYYNLSLAADPIVNYWALTGLVGE